MMPLLAFASVNIINLPPVEALSFNCSFMEVAREAQSAIIGF